MRRREFPALTKDLIIKLYKYLQLALINI